MCERTINLKVLGFCALLSSALAGDGFGQDTTRMVGPRLVPQLGHASGPAFSIDLSPDGKLALSANNGTAISWDVESGGELRRFIVGSNDVTHPISRVVFLPNGRRALAGLLGVRWRGVLEAERAYDGGLVLWDVSTGTEIRWFIRPASSAYATFSINWRVYAVASSPDGRRALTGGYGQVNSDGTWKNGGTVVLWDVDSGLPVRDFVGHTREVYSVAFSSNGRLILTGSTDSTAVIWDVRSGDVLHRLVGHEGPVNLVAFSADGQLALTGVRIGNSGGTARLWSVDTGAELRRFDGVTGTAFSFSADGQSVVAAREDGSVSVFSVRTGAELQRFRSGSRVPIYSLVVSRDNERVLTSGGVGIGEMSLWNLDTGVQLRELRGRVGWVTSASFSPDGRHILSGRADGTAPLWDLEGGRVVTRFPSHRGGVTATAFSPSGERVLVGGSRGRSAFVRVFDVDTGEQASQFGDYSRYVESITVSPDGWQALTRTSDEIHVWDIETGSELSRLQGHLRHAQSVALSPDGRHALTTSSEGYDNIVQLWRLPEGVEARRWRHPNSRCRNVTCIYTSAAFSPDGEWILAGSNDGVARIWDTETGAEIQRFDSHLSSEQRAGMIVHGAGLTSATFSSDGRRVLTGSIDNTVRLWDVETGAELQAFKAHQESGFGNVPFEPALSPDGRRAVTGSTDGTVRLWDLDSGTLIVTLISFSRTGWAVVAPDGRFDASDLERVEGLRWAFSDDPFRALPVEIFMRDFYEPRLLPRLLNGEEFEPQGALDDRNRVQPRVQLVEVKVNDSAATVTVDVAARERYFPRAESQGDSVLVRSGAADLRLFRDGHVVRWRDGPIPLGPGGSARVVFENIPLPRTGANSVTFSAYAFSENYTASDGSEWIGRVKSATAYDTVSLRMPAPRPGRAYLVTIGVDAYEDPAWNLNFAAEDARLLSDALQARLAAAGSFAEVVPVPLISAHEQAETTLATKEAIRAVFALLAGEEIASDLRARIPNADRIRQARPEDLVLVSFSAHGYADQGGTFYLFPSDIGRETGKRVTRAILERAVSSEELTAWLRPVDAGEMTLIVDACHSAAAVEGAGFKPGPMGSRGFGQLAFDKGMRVLAASQAEDVALESALLRQGLLTYALVQDGLEAGQADHEPEDGRIMLGEWLGYGVERVPSLFDEVQRGEVQTFGRDMRSVPVGQGTQDPHFQRPALFDFRKDGREGTVLVGPPAGR